MWEDIEYNSDYDAEFEEMWKLEDQLNNEKDIKKVSREEMEKKARGVQKGLALVCILSS